MRRISLWTPSFRPAMREAGAAYPVDITIYCGCRGARLSPQHQCRHQDALADLCQVLPSMLAVVAEAGGMKGVSVRTRRRGDLLTVTVRKLKNRMK